MGTHLEDPDKFTSGCQMTSQLGALKETCSKMITHVPVQRSREKIRWGSARNTQSWRGWGLSEEPLENVMERQSDPSRA